MDILPPDTHADVYLRNEESTLCNYFHISDKLMNWSLKIYDFR